MSKEITNSDDIIDSRDVIARIEELEAERQALHDAVDEAAEAIEAFEGDLKSEAFDTLHDAHDKARNAMNEWGESDEGKELAALKALADEAEGYAPDWRYGEALIRDSYFTEYAQQLADDIGAINSDASWPNNCIDWERAARELQMDYTQVEFDGVTYWIR
jgi:hypothetical protein